MSLLQMRWVFALILGFGFVIGPFDLSVAQSGPPTIVNYQIQRTNENGKDWLVFTWDVSNVDRVIFLQEGKEIPSRIQLPGGAFGWPPKMPGAFRTTGTTGTYSLIAENQHGRVEARGRYDGGTCYAWLVPPDNHWSRCRRGGQIASNLSTTAPLGRPRCNVEGRVTSSFNFVTRVPKNPLNQAAGSTTYRLDVAVLRRADGSGRARPLNLSGRGPERRYRITGLAGGHDYVVSLGWNWRTKPEEIRFHCPSSPGEHAIRLQTLHNYDFRYDY